MVWMGFLGIFCHYNDVQIKGNNVRIGDNVFLITSGKLRDMSFFFLLRISLKKQNNPKRQNRVSFQEFTIGKYLYS